jgi:hypothetical protein
MVAARRDTTVGWVVALRTAERTGVAERADVVARGTDARTVAARADTVADVFAFRVVARPPRLCVPTTAAFANIHINANTPENNAIFFIKTLRYLFNFIRKIFLMKEVNKKTCP